MCSSDLSCVKHALAVVSPLVSRGGEVPPSTPLKRKRSVCEGDDDIPMPKRVPPSMLIDRGSRVACGIGEQEGRRSITDRTVGLATPCLLRGRDRSSRITHNEAQAVRYMECLMFSTIRSFGIGLLIEDDDMRIWYGDRMGIIVTRKFKWLKDDDLTFLRCIAAMGHADVHGMGSFPDLQFLEMGENTPTPGPRYEVSHFSMMARRPGAPEAELLEFSLDVRGDSSVYAESSMVGRGTSVVPVIAKPGTMAHAYFQDEELVVKIAWPYATSRAEDGTIIAVRKVLKEKKPQYLPYIVDLKCSDTRTISELGLPRLAMHIAPEKCELRVCRTLVMKRYQRVETVESVEDFKKIFVDIVRGTKSVVGCFVKVELTRSYHSAPLGLRDIPHSTP